MDCLGQQRIRILSIEGDFVIHNLLVRIHFIIELIGWVGLAPWKFEFSFPGSLISTFLGPVKKTRSLVGTFLILRGNALVPLSY